VSAQLPAPVAGADGAEALADGAGALADADGGPADGLGTGGTTGSDDPDGTAAGSATACLITSPAITIRRTIPALHQRTLLVIAAHAIEWDLLLLRRCRPGEAAGHLRHDPSGPHLTA
jgi:hypothetical protein